MNKIIKILKKAADSELQKTITFSDGSELEIDSDIALQVLDIYESLDEFEKLSFEEAIEISADDFISEINEHSSEINFDDDLTEE
mgnify:CR=1 FL=1